jgi:hypothetical protein
MCGGGGMAPAGGMATPGCGIAFGSFPALKAAVVASIKLWACEIGLDKYPFRQINMDEI